jgi:predicted metalloprotease with PDZ domain
MTRPNTHYMDVAMDLQPARDPREGGFYLAMPVWTPGHYLVEDYARNVLHVKAFDGTTGEELKVTKRVKNRWFVESRNSNKVKVEYAVAALAYDDTKSYIDQSHAMINGASVFLYPEGMEGNPIRLTLAPPADWKKVSTGLEQLAEWEFLAPNYDVLIDSPMEVGNQRIDSFVVQGVEHQVSTFGPAPINVEKFVTDLKSIVEKTIPVFGEVPYKRYVFLVNFTDNVGGGLEHLNSTVCMVPRLILTPREEYNVTMGLFSHEFFHTWNVKRLRPNGLGPFDYSAETYTKSLWIAEGITSYYDDLILRRTGLYSVEEYLDAFAANVNILKSLPGSRHQSAEESSFDTWIKFYKPDANSQNATSSYYTQGAVIGWMLDLEMRMVTRSTRTLDDAMRKIYQETYVKEDRGYSDEEFEAVCREIGGDGVVEIFDARVRGRRGVDYDRYLGYAGLRLVEKDDQSSQEKGFLGIRSGSEGGRTIVRTSLAGSPAEAMGLTVNDEIVGIDGIRVGSEELSFYIATRAPGSSVVLTVARNARLMEVRGELAKKPPFAYRIQPLKDATLEQKDLFKRWLLGEWMPQLKYSEYVHSPGRRSTLDFV